MTVNSPLKQDVPPYWLVVSIIVAMPFVSLLFSIGMFTHEVSDGDFNRSLFSGIAILTIEFQATLITFFWRRIQTRVLKKFIALILVFVLWGTIINSLLSVMTNYLLVSTMALFVIFPCLLGMSFVTMFLFACLIPTQKSKHQKSQVMLIMTGGLLLLGFVFAYSKRFLTMPAPLDYFSEHYIEDIPTASVAKIVESSHELQEVKEAHGKQNFTEENSENDKKSNTNEEDVRQKYLAQFDKEELCNTGKTQSPINLTEDRIQSKALKINFKHVPLKLEKHPFNFYLYYEGEGYIRINKKKSFIKQAHFHIPSEHKINGVIFPAEIHFVTKDPDTNQLAVVGVVFEEGKENPFVTEMLDELESHHTDEGESKSFKRTLMDLIPSQRIVYNYEGSLTTPPCTEGVHWFVMRIPMSLSPDQIQKLKTLYPFNARPIVER